MTALTLPGSIPGLLRRGSPVVLTIEHHDNYVTVEAGARGVVLSVEGDWAWVAFGAAGVHPEGPSLCFVPLSFLALDLGCATGRAHAAWWLAEHGGPGLRRQPGWPVEAVAFVHGSYGWLLTGLRSPHTGWMGRQPTGMTVGLHPRLLPTLAHLDPDDPRTLPDGSRWVDAEALRLVVLHVAGVTP